MSCSTPPSPPPSPPPQCGARMPFLFLETSSLFFSKYLVKLECFFFFSDSKNFRLLIYSALVSPHFVVLLRSFITFYVASEATRQSLVSPIYRVSGLSGGAAAQSRGTIVLLPALPLSRLWGPEPVTWLLGVLISSLKIGTTLPVYLPQGCG